MSAKGGKQTLGLSVRLRQVSDSRIKARQELCANHPRPAFDVDFTVPERNFVRVFQTVRLVDVQAFAV